MSIYQSIHPTFLSSPYFSVAVTHIHNAHMATQMHNNKCQGSSPPCCPQVMHAWHFVKMTAEESHHKLLLTEADGPMVHHLTQHAESLGNFLSSVSPPSTSLWLQQKLQSVGCQPACCIQPCLTMQVHVCYCLVLCCSQGPASTYG